MEHACKRRIEQTILIPKKQGIFPEHVSTRNSFLRNRDRGAACAMSPVACARITEPSSIQVRSFQAAALPRARYAMLAVDMLI